jgi:hypothetical protein
MMYLQCLQDAQISRIYDEVEKGEHNIEKKKIICDPSQLSVCVDHLKLSFLVTTKKYKMYRRCNFT